MPIACYRASSKECGKVVWVGISRRHCIPMSPFPSLIGISSSDKAGGDTRPSYIIIGSSRCSHDYVFRQLPVIERFQCTRYRMKNPNKGSRAEIDDMRVYASRSEGQLSFAKLNYENMNAMGPSIYRRTDAVFRLGFSDRWYCLSNDQAATGCYSP